MTKVVATSILSMLQSLTPQGIDVSFDVRSDAGGKDPDQHSATLQAYHRVLWSKPLPSGALFELTLGRRGQLHCESELGHFKLTSDTVFRTFRRHRKMQPIIAQVPETQQAEFSRRGYTIGGFLIFPGNRINGRPTINQARGMSSRIEDRFDLTLECIRRHYSGAESPLSVVLDQYSDFFALFDSFEGYVNFFLLQDLVTENHEGVDFLLPFEDFGVSPALPQTLAEYRLFRDRMLQWIENRNTRIASWCQL